MKDKEEWKCPVKDCKIIYTEDQCKNCSNQEFKKYDENYPFIGVTWSG